jgi:hypothetical protein
MGMSEFENFAYCSGYGGCDPTDATNASRGKVPIRTWSLPQRDTTCYSNFADSHYRHPSLNNFGNPATSQFWIFYADH